MTAEEAIQIIERVIHTESKWPGTEGTVEALDMSIAALRAQKEREHPQPLKLEDVTQAYLEICGNDCVGDDSVGVPCCQFYDWPDVDQDGHPCPGGCRLNAYRHKPEVTTK